MAKQYSQTPGQGEIFLDHVGWFVPDMDAAAGHSKPWVSADAFTVHMNEQPDGSRVPSGTANRCAMIRRGYLEVLTRVPDIESVITQQMDAGLARYTGLHLIAFTVSDTDATTARLREQGFSPDPPVALRRPMPLDDGGEGTAAFSVIRLPNDAMLEGRVQVLSQDSQMLYGSDPSRPMPTARRAVWYLICATTLRKRRAATSVSPAEATRQRRWV